MVIGIEAIIDRIAKQVQILVYVFDALGGMFTGMMKFVGIIDANSESETNLNINFKDPGKTMDSFRIDSFGAPTNIGVNMATT